MDIFDVFMEEHKEEEKQKVEIFSKTIPSNLNDFNEKLLNSGFRDYLHNLKTEIRVSGDNDTLNAILKELLVIEKLSIESFSGNLNINKSLCPCLKILMLNNALEIDSLPDTVEELYIMYPDAPKLGTLKKINYLPTSIKKLNAIYNEIESLPEHLPFGLKYINCKHNKLTHLPALPPHIEFIDCSYNGITLLPIIPKSLKQLWFSYNNISKLPISIVNIVNKDTYTNHDIIYYNNPIANKITKKHPSGYHYDKFQFFVEMINAVKTIENWYLKVRYNPQYKYCRKCVNNDYNELYNDNVVQKITN